ncbi:hypothetical protein ABZW30_30115 [Kitasatospora sp. NPDC004669]|uniref:hypothetical protein n=1 Tax=Kitasatospora sp. NPDC004669 TaxID=3154555 RepID=UPI0033BB6AEA
MTTTRLDPDVDALLHLIDRAERGALLPAEAELLRAGVRGMANYRDWCVQWSRRAAAYRSRIVLLRRALVRALGRARRTAAAEAELRDLQAVLAEVEPVQSAYEQLLTAQLLPRLTAAGRRPAAANPPGRAAS